MSIARETKITSNGIKKSLQQCTPERAIAEYIWNGFDAGASSVQVGFNKQHPDLDIIDGFYIEDNGSGIPLEKLNEKFEPYLESAKSKDKNKRIRTSENQGNDGQGRLTFFTFCESATWQTV